MHLYPVYFWCNGPSYYRCVGTLCYFCLKSHFCDTGQGEKRMPHWRKFGSNSNRYFLNFLIDDGKLRIGAHATRSIKDL